MSAHVDLALLGINKLLSLLLMSLALLADVAGQQLCDHCNCQISSVIEPQAIYRLSLVCNTGTITWFGASGGIRLELMPFLRGNFRACFQGHSENIHVKIFKENQEVVSATNYRLKLEEESRTLKLEHLVTSSAKSSEFCLNSRSNEPLLLYLEAVRTPGVEGVPKIMFHYDLEKLDARALLDPMDDCRPCTKEEMLDSYCSMDFVVVGSLADVSHSDTTALSDVTLHVKQVIHQREPHFFQRTKRSDSYLTGHMTVPKKCGIRQGTGDFILTGRYRLNSLTLRCASYLHQWRTIQHEAECSHV